MRDSILRVAPPVALLSSPGAAWLAEAPGPSAGPREERIWRASGVVEPVPPPRQQDVWRVGPLVHVEPHTRADVWRAHLRRWRATARDGFLTFSGRIFSASSAPPSRTQLVTGRGDVVVRDPASDELIPFELVPSDVTRVTLLPARDDVTAELVVEAAIRLQDGRRRVLLGH